MDQNSTLVEEKRFSFIWTAFAGLLIGMALAIGAFYLDSKEVTLTIDGVSFTHVTRAQDVAGVLSELGMLLSDVAKVEPGLSQAIKTGSEIRLIKQIPETPEPLKLTENFSSEPKFEVRYSTEEIATPFKVIKRPSDQFVKGVERLLVQGKEGLIRRTRKLVEHEGEEIAQYLVVEKVIREPVDQIILIGTQEPVKTVSTKQGAYRYKEVKNMLATAYYPGPESTAPFDDGFTAIGLEAGYGIVAVDPRIIPLRTRLYIPGYGVAIAGDVGGAIKGNRVDLCYETIDEAMQFGKKWVQVYVLE